MDAIVSEFICQMPRTELKFPNIARFAMLCPSYVSSWSSTDDIALSVDGADINSASECNVIALPHAVEPTSIIRKLPIYYSDVIVVCRITTCESFPVCRVELRYAGFLTRLPNDIDDECDENDLVDYYFRSDDDATSNVFDKNANFSIINKFLIADVRTVPSVFCPAWPSEASDWPMRPRQSGWPEARTVETVMSYGCDVVMGCEYDCSCEHTIFEQMTSISNPQTTRPQQQQRTMWKLSFKRSETVLLNSLPSVTQTLCRLLRRLTKITLGEEDGRNCTRFINSGCPAQQYVLTALFWFFESQWSDFDWSSASELVQNCSAIIANISSNIRSGKSMSNYFLNQTEKLADDVADFIQVDYCHLFPLATLERLERFADKSALTDWILQIYVDQTDSCAAHCSMRTGLLDYIAHKNNEKSPSRYLELSTAKELSSLVACLSANAMDRSFNKITTIMKRIHFAVEAANKCSASQRSYYGEYSENIDDRLQSFYLAAIFVDLARRCDVDEVDKPIKDFELVDRLVTLLFQNSSPKSHLLSPLRRAMAMLQHVIRCDVRDSSADLRLTLCYVYLGKASSLQDDAETTDLGHLKRLLNVYRMVLCYITAQYQRVIDELALFGEVAAVFRPPKSRDYVLEAPLLITVDHDVDKAVGLTTFYRFLLEAATATRECDNLDQQQQQRQRQRRQTPVSCCFTVDLFARYLKLIVLVDSELDVSSLFHAVGRYVHRFFRYGTKRLLFCGDVLLAVFFIRKVSTLKTTKRCYEPQTVLNLFPQFTEGGLRQLLMKMATDHLTSFHQVMARDFRSRERKIVTTGMSSMYDYRCLKFRSCLEVSDENVDELWSEQETEVDTGLQVVTPTCCQSKLADRSLPVIVGPVFSLLVERTIACVDALVICCLNGSRSGSDLENDGGSRNRTSDCSTLSQLSLSLHLSINSRLQLMQANYSEKMEMVLALAKQLRRMERLYCQHNGRVTSCNNHVTSGLELDQWLLALSFRKALSAFNFNKSYEA